eukprot:3941906-Rhodomonas_salina.5
MSGTEPAYAATLGDEYVVTHPSGRKGAGEEGEGGHNESEEEEEREVVKAGDKCQPCPAGSTICYLPTQCYAMSGTGIAYGAVCPAVFGPSGLAEHTLSLYALQCDARHWRSVCCAVCLRGVRYWTHVCCCRRSLYGGHFQW